MCIQLNVMHQGDFVSVSILWWLGVLLLQTHCHSEDHPPQLSLLATFCWDGWLHGVLDLAHVCQDRTVAVQLRSAASFPVALLAFSSVNIVP